MMRILVAIVLIGAFSEAQVGPSGIVSPDGKNVQFSRDFAQGIVLVGPSGIVSTHGNLQLTPAQASLARTKRSLPTFAPVGSVFGPSGYLTPEGVNVQFTPEQADNIVLQGPSGVVTKDGRNIQFRQKRSLRQLKIPAGSNVGPSGFITPDGQLFQFTHEQADNIVLAGPSGLIAKDGKNLQFRTKRTASQPRRDHIIGDSGIITSDGQNIQFKQGGVKITLEGPSGILLSDGTQIQKRHN